MSRRSRSSMPGRAPVVGANRLTRLPLAHESVLEDLEGSGHLEPFVGSPVPFEPVYRGRTLARDRVLRSELLVPRARVKFRSPLVVRPWRLPLSDFRIPVGLRIRVPWKVRFCVSRKARKEVLFARGKIGFRRSSPGRGGGYVRRESSNYHC